MPILNGLKTAFNLMMIGMVLGLTLCLPQMVHQHQSALKTCSVMLGKAQKQGLVSRQAYEEFEGGLEQAGIRRLVSDITIDPGLDVAVQKRDAISVGFVIHYEVVIPFVGKKQVTGERIVLQVFSHKYFKP